MNPYQNSRLRNLYEDTTQKPNNINLTGLFDPQPTVKEPVNPLTVPDTGLAALRGRARPYMDQLKEFYSSEPNRKDYQLSKLGKVLASASGIIEGGVNKNVSRGVGLARNIMDEPYETAKSDWASKGGRLSKLSQIEDTELGDQEKLEVAIAADDAKKRDDLRQWILAQSTVKLNESQIKNRENEIKNRGLELRVNANTGNMDLYDKTTNSFTTLNKVAETPKEKGDREFNEFLKKFGVEQKGREKIIGMNFSNDQIMEGIKEHHAIQMQGMKENADVRLTKLKANLDKLTPDQRNKAFSGAYEEVLTMNPGMRNLLFDTKDGVSTLKKDYNPELFGVFQSSVQELMKQRMGEPSSGLKDGAGNPKAGEEIVPQDNETSSVDISNVEPARIEQAKAWLTNKGYEVSNESIAEFIRQDDIEKAAGVNPQVALPEAQGTPDVGLEAIKNLPGMISRNIYFGDYSTPHAPVQRTDPNSDTGLNAIGGMINSIRNAPQNIYDPQGLAARRNRR